MEKIQKDFGWMAALRYCKLVREGVMQETVDLSIGNYAILQQHLLNMVLLTVRAFDKMGVKNNPYMTGQFLRRLQRRILYHSKSYIKM